MELEWYEDYDDRDNTVYLAKTKVYSEDFYYRINIDVENNNLIWGINNSSSELLAIKNINKFKKLELAKNYCQYLENGWREYEQSQNS